MDEEYVLILDKNGSPIYDDDGDVMIERVADGARFYVPPNSFSEQGERPIPVRESPYSKTEYERQTPVSESPSLRIKDEKRTVGESPYSRTEYERRTPVSESPLRIKDEKRTVRESPYSRTGYERRTPVSESPLRIKDEKRTVKESPYSRTEYERRTPVSESPLRIKDEKRTVKESPYSRTEYERRTPVSESPLRIKDEKRTPVSESSCSVTQGERQTQFSDLLSLRTQETTSPEGEGDTPSITTYTHWTKQQISSLIQLYKANKPQFASSTIRNTKVWQKISAELGGTHTATQCENKFKYLKMKYLQKKDNMSNKSSGARLIHFEHFNEMDEIFAREPIVVPVAIASSSRENAFVNNEEEQNETLPVERTHSDTGGRSRRSIKLKEALQDLNKILTESEVNKLTRHTELMELQRDTMNKFTELMNKILDKM